MLSMASTISTEFPVWFITGASSGFGKAIALEALKRGHKVIATARNITQLDELRDKGAHVMALDVTSSDETLVKKAAVANSIYERITHLVNSAGYILEGMVEECSTQEVFGEFNTNVFGLIKVIRAVMPYMRETKAAYPKVIANFGSTGSWTGWPSSSIYCSSKWAVSGLTEGLDLEMAPFGIKAIVIEPGAFRTRFMAPACGGRQYAECRLPAYKETREAINNLMDNTHNAQLGDVAKGAQVIVDVLTLSNMAEGKEMPQRLLLGSDSMDVVRGKCSKTLQLIDNWSEVIKTTDGTI